MRESVWPARDMHGERLVVLSIKAATVGQDFSADFIVIEIDHLWIAGAAENPRLSVGRSTSFEDRTIEEHAARAKALVARKQTAESFSARSILTKKTRSRQKRKHLNARQLFGELRSELRQVSRGRRGRETNYSRLVELRRGLLRV